MPTLPPLEYAPDPAHQRRSYLGVLLLSVFVFGVLFAFWLPMKLRDRHIVREMECAAQLRSIGAAVQAYAQTNGGAFPPDLSTLVSASGLS